MADEPKVDASQLDNMSFKEGLVELDEIVRALEGNQLELHKLSLIHI